MFRLSGDPLGKLGGEACFVALLLRLCNVSSLPEPAKPAITAVMKCPYCRVDNDRVIDSRASDDGYSIRRRRECVHCQRRYTTYERLDETSIKIVKKGGGREPFDVRKLREGISKACWKRPVSELQIDGIIAHVLDRVFGDLDNEVDSALVGEFVMQALREVDQVAYIRFASVYRQFDDVHDFVQEMAPMLEQDLGTRDRPVSDNGNS